MTVETVLRGEQVSAVTGNGAAYEDAGRGGAQGGGVDAGPLQCLPGGLQEQPLLRVHGEGLARRDPEELRVEVRDAVDESGGAGVGGAHAGRVRVEQGVQIPAAVGGVVAHGIAFVGEQLPQLFGRADAAGEATAHADDDDRVVVACNDRHRDGGCTVLTAFALDAEPDGDLGRESGGSGMVEDRGHRQPQSRRGTDPVTQFDSGQ